MTAIDRYATEVGGVARELFDLLRDRDLAGEAAAIARTYGIDGLLDMTPDETDAALTFLAKTPAQREKAVARLEDRKAALLIMRARCLGLRSARLLSLVADMQFITGASYREAARRGAIAAAKIADYPSIDDLWAPSGERSRFALPYE